jgi:threonine/homoserine/homoserine lactone efflux protein
LGVNLFLGRHENVLYVLQIVSVPILLFLSWKSFRPPAQHEPKMYRRSNAFMTGLLLNLMNAGLLPLWLGVTSLMSARFAWFGETTTHLTAYAVGVMVGTMILHLCVIFLSASARGQIPDAARIAISRVIGVVFLFLAVYQVYVIFTHGR